MCFLECCGCSYGTVFQESTFSNGAMYLEMAIKPECTLRIFLARQEDVFPRVLQVFLCILVAIRMV